MQTTRALSSVYSRRPSPLHLALASARRANTAGIVLVYVAHIYLKVPCAPK